MNWQKVIDQLDVEAKEIESRLTADNLEKVDLTAAMTAMLVFIGISAALKEGLKEDANDRRNLGS